MDRNSSPERSLTESSPDHQQTLAIPTGTGPRKMKTASCEDASLDVSADRKTRWADERVKKGEGDDPLLPSPFLFLQGWVRKRFTFGSGSVPCLIHPLSLDQRVN